MGAGTFFQTNLRKRVGLKAPSRNQKAKHHANAFCDDRKISAQSITSPRTLGAVGVARAAKRASAKPGKTLSKEDTRLNALSKDGATERWPGRDNFPDTPPHGRRGDKRARIVLWLPPDTKLRHQKQSGRPRPIPQGKSESQHD